ncbi:glycosyltransferase [Cryptosporangium japonicum]|uniref:Glycosyltransferase 2-like domain-containing protein n=1 Tax=Cryptosporangium japonicum TaxID=80872 RepID=A0ABN0TE40_9ACTN
MPADLDTRVGTGQFELSDPVLTIPPSYRRVRLLVRFHGEVLGYLEEEAPAGGLDAADVRARCVERYRTRITEHLRAEGLPPLGDGFPAATTACPTRPTTHPGVTLVVCTRDRASALGDCLAGLRALDYPHLEIVIVDNAPSDDSTRLVVADLAGDDPRFRYVVEPRPGLSRARNRGAREATGEIIVYTDDDVTVEPDWITAVVRGFERAPGVGCVTGLVATAAIEGPAERYFDARVTWAKNCVPKLYDLDRHRDTNPLYPYSPGIFGTGANFAFRARALRHVGYFDEALGAGTLTRGGEDLDAFVAVLRTGWVLAYEPNAVVWHHHRADPEALRGQMYGYGTGLSAFVTKHLLDRRSLLDVVRRLVPGALRLATALRAASDAPAHAPAETAPPGVVRAEIRGLLAGPFLYVRARRKART